jgi:hypothetical protein
MYVLLLLLVIFSFYHIMFLIFNCGNNNIQLCPSFQSISVS